MNQTASWLEILAAVVNVLGIMAAGRMLHMTVRRYRAVKRQAARYPTGKELLAAWRHIRCEVGRIAMHSGSIALGTWAMTLPSGDSWYGYAAMWFRVLIGGLFLAFSVIDLHTDGRLWDAMTRDSVRRL